MSFSRPDPSSPASVADAGFGTSRRGYDQGEVRDFLRMIAAELGRLQERERFLERELRTAQTSPDLNSTQLDDATLTRLLGEETARVLTTARESGVEIRQKAEQAASQMLTEAAEEAGRMREEAEIEASRRRTDAAADAEAELSMAKQQGREMVNEARAYRERVLSELARRRELAREQIEQLLHGRDRLMQSFERARLVAIDVVAELQPLGEPDEYVNLAPTTGPVPMMVPNAPRPAEPVSDKDRVEAANEAQPVEVESAEVELDGDGADAVGLSLVADDSDDAAEDPVAPVESVESDVEVEAPVEMDADAEVDAEAEVDADVVVEAQTDVETEIEVVDESVDASDDDSGDDVVVDLFARLRAEAVTVESLDDDAVDTVADIVEETFEDAVADDESIWSEPEPEPEVAETSAPTAFEQRDADLTPIIVGAARKLKRVLADEQNEALEALRRKEPVRSLDDLLPSNDAHIERYTSAIADDLLAAAGAGAAMVSSDGSAKLSKAAGKTATHAADAVLGEWLVEPLRERLERCVLDGDADNVGIGKRVRAVYREWKTQHIDEQLDDVIRAAHGRAMLAAMGEATAVVWVCDDTQQGCSDCDDNTLAGAITAGEAFPTGHTFAPAHIGCRCLLLPADR